ncbi:MAG: hypothetical protein LBQ95_01380 [Lachnospiraceae bacterium]|jgi:hypothetical protein|nr:hypothetical protein [Lachnospiraceae bacterium]
MELKQEFVEVIARIKSDGSVRPLSLIYQGRPFEIDKLKYITPRAASKAGGTGVRYSIVVSGRDCFLYEDEGRWWVERKVQ